MTHAEKVSDILRAFDLQITEEAQARFLGYLKRQAKEGDKGATEALRVALTRWGKV